MTSAVQDILTPRQKIAGILFALVAAIGFSAKAILVKLAYIDPVDPITLLALRMAFSLPFFLVVAARTNRSKHNQRLTVRDKYAVIGLGLIGYYLASYLDFLGLQYISAGLERLMLFLYPTMVSFFSARTFRPSRMSSSSSRTSCIISRTMPATDVFLLKATKRNTS